jgi:riboflavin synthase
VFTGIIQGRGRLTALTRNGRERRLSIRALFPLDDLADGESIAVNGACLTVESGGDSCFTVYASEETLQHTNLAFQERGALLNLERALALGQRLGGHLVSGHVDCLAVAESVKGAGESLTARFGFPRAFAPLVIPKGSVALDGISLTVNNCGEDFLEVNVIPETRRVTSAGEWKPGARVNMETDLIGKYVRHMLAPFRAPAGEQAGARDDAVDAAFLREHGFL